MSGAPYSADHFIAKFSAIPEERWCTGVIEDGQGRCCVFGHCGDTENSRSSEGDWLASLVWPHIGFSLHKVNDGIHPSYQQPTPKQRVLAALEDIKAGRV